jgi:hypothetical protein
MSGQPFPQRSSIRTASSPDLPRPCVGSWSSNINMAGTSGEHESCQSFQGQGNLSSRTYDSSFFQIIPLTERIDRSKTDSRHSRAADKLHQQCKSFNSDEIERISEQILAHSLVEQAYDPHKCKELSQSIAANILDKIKDFGSRHFKLVCIVSIGSVKERPGMQFGSRCLWNKDTDKFVSVRFTNSTLFAVAMVYGLYIE